jgi:hypothetical protein
MAAVATGTEAMAMEAATETAAVAMEMGYANAGCASVPAATVTAAVGMGTEAMAMEAVLAKVRSPSKHTLCGDRSRCPAWY